MTELEPSQDSLQNYLDRFVPDEGGVVFHRDLDTGQLTTPNGTVAKPIESLIETEEELNHLKQELKDGTRNVFKQVATGLCFRRQVEIIRPTKKEKKILRLFPLPKVQVCFVEKTRKVFK